MASFVDRTFFAVMIFAGLLLAGCGSIGQKDPISMILESTGIVAKKTQSVEYKPRSPVVIPANTAYLPPPADGNKSINWPQDPDKKKRLDNDGKVGASPEIAGKPLSKEQLLKRRLPGAYGDSSTFKDSGSRLSPAQLRAQYQKFHTRRYPVVKKGNATKRKRLLDPPPSLWQAAPAGAKPGKKANEDNT